MSAAVNDATAQPVPFSEATALFTSAGTVTAITVIVANPEPVGLYLVAYLGYRFVNP